MKWIRLTGVAAAVAMSMAAAGCGDLATEGRSPVQLVVASLQAASGAEPDDFGGTLNSDVITNVSQTINGAEVLVPTIFNDVAEVTMALILKDPGQPGRPAEPSALNQVTITRYRVTYRRTDGRNTAGVDVPYPFDSGVTFTVPAEGTVSAGFQIVRHTAKQEAPLAALRTTADVISTIATVTFYGQDLAGNDISASASIGIDFGNFGDPE